MPAHRKVSLAQFDLLVEWMVAHPEFARGTNLVISQGDQQTQRLLEELSSILNAVPSGIAKTPEGWRAYWRSLKYRTREKGKRIQSRMCTSDGPPLKAFLTPNEDKILSVVGVESVNGVQTVKIPLNDPFGEEMVIPLKEEVEEANNLQMIVTRVVATNNLDRNQTRAEETNNLELKQSRTDSPDPQPSISLSHRYSPPLRQTSTRQTSDRSKRKKENEDKDEDINIGVSADENKSALEESRRMLIRLEAKRCKTNRYLADSMKQMAESFALVAGSFSTVAQSIRDLTTEVRNSYRNNRSQSGRRNADRNSLSSSSSDL